MFQTGSPSIHDRMFNEAKEKQNSARKDRERKEREARERRKSSPKSNNLNEASINRLYTGGKTISPTK